MAPLQCAKYSSADSWLAQHNQEQRLAANSEFGKFGHDVGMFKSVLSVRPSFNFKPSVFKNELTQRHGGLSDLSMWLAATSYPKSSFTCLTTSAPKVIEWPQILNADAFKTWLLKSREQAIDLDLSSWLYIPSAAKPAKSNSLDDGIGMWLSQTASAMSTSTSASMDETPMLSRSRSFETVEMWLASAVDDCGDAMTEDDESSIQIIEDEDDDEFLEVKGEDLGYWLTNMSM